MELFPLYDWFASISIGWFVVSYWRSSWVLMDLWTCQQPQNATLAEGNSFCRFVESTMDAEIAELRVWSARMSYLIGMVCLFVGVFMIWWGLWIPDYEQRVTKCIAVVRFAIIYILGWSAVNIWRAIWYWADDWILPAQPYLSYWTTSVAGSTLCFLLWAGNSLLAPPSIFLLDGPGLASPPIAVTLISSHYAVTLPVGEKPPELPLPAKIVDVVLSFVVLPFGVVWFWRGSWLLLDYGLWGFTVSDKDINISLLWSFILAVIACFLTSEPIFGSIDRRCKKGVLLSLLGRLRTYIMAWGTVAFWRLVWLIWDQFLGGTTYLSAGLGHSVSIVVLTLAGCVSSVCAPASTIGVDSVPDENAADEPLFSVLPLPYELVTFMGIAREPEEQEESVKDDEERSELEMGSIQKLSDREATSQKSKKFLTIDETEPGPVLLPDRVESESQISSDTADGLERVQPVADEGITSSRRGIRVDGNFRSYTDMQRENVTRSCTGYAQRPGMGNKRSRSQLFRSR